MSKVIGVMGESGSGKTTSMRNLPFKRTFYIDADRKGLSWKGWRQQYNAQYKNYYKCNEPDKILMALQKIQIANMPFDYIVIDTINGVMVGDEMRKSKEKGYDKWVDLAQSIWDILDYANNMDDQYTVIVIAHSETIINDNGYMFTRIRTSGRKLSKIVLESKMTTVLLAKTDDGRFVFETKANSSTAKTPLGAFEEMEIDNDIMTVIEALKDY